MRVCFLSEVRKHRALCDYWMGGVLQIFGVEKNLAMLS